MGGSKTNSSSDSSSTTTFSNTNQVNPYFTSSTNKNGKTNVAFTKGSAGQTAYNFVNKNLQGLLNNYLNPSMNDPTIQANMNMFRRNLNEESQNALQNNILNPLLNNNMIRSSQATNMYNNLSNQMNKSYADYLDSQIAGARDMYGSMIDKLVNMYTQGYTGATKEEGQSINASLGTGTTSSNSNTSSKA